MLPARPHAGSCLRTLTWLRALVFGLLLLVGGAGAMAQFTTSANQAVVYDFETWQRLYTKNADEPMSPSSMTKIMTAYLVFEGLEAGDFTLQSRFRISENAYRPVGSRMWLRLETRVPVDQLLNGLIVQSGNDAAVALAEGVSGSVEAFVDRMNATAERLGMRNTRFANPSALSAQGHYSTAQDIALLSRALIADFPQFYDYFSRPSYTYDNIRQNNRNLLLGGPLGVDGIKTGYTQAGGYGQATSAIDPETGRRVIVVINGANSIAARRTETQRLIEFGLEDFSNHDLFSAGQIIGHAPIWLGTREQVPLVVQRQVRRTLRVDAINSMQGRLVLYNSPLEAPVQAGQEVGRLLYFPLGVSDEEALFQEPIYAAQSVPALTRVEAAIRGVQLYLLGS